MGDFITYGFVLVVVIILSILVYKYTTPDGEVAPTVEHKNVTQDGSIKNKFSWTTLFFGFFVPLIRSDWKWAVIMFLIGAITCGLSNIYFAFTYNKIYNSEH